MPFSLNLNKIPLCQTLKHAFETSQNTAPESIIIKSSTHILLGIYYERCQLTETQLSGEIR